MSNGYGRSTEGFGIDRNSSVNLIVETALDNGVTDPRQIAYILATAQHESRNFTAPDEDFGRKQANELQYHGGEEYFGRGYVHITHLRNYEKFDRLLNLDGELVKNPYLAKDPELAAEILVVGMRDGLFTGKRLSHYINEDTHDLYNARRTVNGITSASSWSIPAAKSCEQYAKEWEEMVPALIGSAKRDRETVRLLQESLNKLSITDAKGRALAENGLYTQQTREAVESFQHQHSLHLDGVAGPETRRAVHLYASAPNPMYDASKFVQQLRMGLF